MHRTVGSRKLSAEQSAYIAGLIDGEGTTTLSRLHANENRRLVISIANTEIQLLEFVLQATGVGKITWKRRSSERHTQSYCYSVASRQALSLLENVTPFLKSYKRDRAQLALDLYLSVTPRNGRYSPEQLAARERFEKRFLSMLAVSKSPARNAVTRSTTTRETRRY
jgi:hypothetical protein